MKRAFDIVFSIIFLILLSPLMMFICLLILLTSGKPAVFKQVRVGRYGKEFTLYKFRTMLTDHEAEQKLDFSKDGIRTTRFGKLLRRIKLDELPQLFNVLMGDMSIVGPRPTLKYQVEKYSERQRKRLSVRPGLTGLAQISGGTTMSWDERIEYDLIYIEKQSMFFDLRIILKTIVVAVRGEGVFKKDSS